MGFKVEKRVERPEAGPGAKSQAGPWQIAGAVFFLLALCYGLAQAYFPVYDACPACEGTGILSCGAPGCVHGRVPCTGSCLKKDDPGWRHMDVEGHSASDIWMRFDNPDGSWEAWNQNHVGHAIEMVNGRWQDTGNCKLCNGTGRMLCPFCQGKNLCPRCGGTGGLRRWLFFI